MLFRKYILLCVLLAVVLLVGLSWRHRPSSPPGKPASLTIEKRPVTFAMHTFDPSAPPADMPALAAWEQAECDSNFVSDANVRARTEILDATDGRVTVTGLKVTLQLAINIWVPQDASDHVIEHEQGHRQIAERRYQSADKVAQQIAAGYLGKQVTVHGADLNLQINQLLQQMGAEITAEYSKKLNLDLAQNRFDDITDHSRNEVGATEAVAQVLKEVP